MGGLYGVNEQISINLKLSGKAAVKMSLNCFLKSVSSVVAQILK